MTEPWGKRNQSAFLNQVIELETVLEPGPLLEACRSIESRLGRKRMEKWGPRTIDIDILLFDSRVVETAELRIPHPRLAERRFVLVPLAEIAPDIRVPGAEQTVSSLLAACKDTGVVQLYRKA
jgi:2-amino-4-hydroxy-6-hydroxymethyldihydropteridine diphosphokinase